MDNMGALKEINSKSITGLITQLDRFLYLSLRFAGSLILIVHEKIIGFTNSYCYFNIGLLWCPCSLFPHLKLTKEHYDVFLQSFFHFISFHRSNQNRMFLRGACNVSQMESHGNYAQNADEMFQDLAYLEAPPVRIYNKINTVCSLINDQCGDIWNEGREHLFNLKFSSKDSQKKLILKGFSAKSLIKLT